MDEYAASWGALTTYFWHPSSVSCLYYWKTCPKFHFLTHLKPKFTSFIMFKSISWLLYVPSKHFLIVSSYPTLCQEKPLPQASDCLLPRQNNFPKISSPRQISNIWGCIFSPSLNRKYANQKISTIKVKKVQAKRVSYFVIKKQ